MTIVIVTYRGAYLRLANNPNAERQAPHVEPAIAGKVRVGTSRCRAKGQHLHGINRWLNGHLNGLLNGQLNGWLNGHLNGRARDLTPMPQRNTAQGSSVTKEVYLSL